MKKIITLLGAPGSGKGTFSKLINQKLKWHHISIGDLMRDEIKNKTAFGREVSHLLHEGKLVPDHIVNEFVFAQLQQVHSPVVILDGFPRTIGQCQFLANSCESKRWKLPSAVLIEVPEWIVVDKMLGRRKCSTCGHDFNVCNIHTPDGYDMPPILPNPATCPLQKLNQCNPLFTQRIDDTSDIIKSRLHDYNRNIQSIKEFYRTTDHLNTFHVKKGVKDIDLLVDLLKHVVEE